MVTKLIDNLNKKEKIKLLIPKERKEITNIIEEMRQEAIYYDKYQEETEWTGKYDNFELAGIFFTFLEYNQQVTRIKEIFNNVKKRVTKEEQKTTELLEENVLNIMENLIEGVDYWEDLEKVQKEIQFQSLKKYIRDNLIRHSKINEIKEGDIYWELDKPQELLEKIENGNLSEVIIESIEKWEQDAITHLKAIAISEIKNKEIAKDLREELEEEYQKSEESNEIIANQKDEIKQLKQRLAEEAQKLEEANQTILNERSQKKELQDKEKELKNQLRLFTKSLPSLPKQDKLKLLGKKLVTKFQQLTQKRKAQEKKIEVIAQIEVKVNNSQN